MKTPIMTPVKSSSNDDHKVNDGFSTEALPITHNYQASWFYIQLDVVPHLTWMSPDIFIENKKITFPNIESHFFLSTFYSIALFPQDIWWEDKEQNVVDTYNINIQELWFLLNQILSTDMLS